MSLTLPTPVPVTFAAARAEAERETLSRAAAGVEQELRRAEVATARVRAAVAFTDAAVSPLRSLECSRKLRRMVMLASLELEGLALDLDRARRAGEEHRREMAALFRTLDGGRGGPASGLRLRLAVRRMFTPDGLPPNQRCLAVNELARVAASATACAEELEQLRTLMEQRVTELAGLVEEITVGLSELDLPAA